MTWTATTRRRVRSVLERVSQMGGADVNDLSREASSLLPLLRESRKPSRVVAPGRSKKSRNEARNERMAKIRAAVMAHAAGRCEVPGCSNEAVEVHHLLSGPLRRIREREDNCVALCRGHHVSLHRGEERLIEEMAGYCEDCGMHEAAASLRRRLDKIAESRAARRSA